MSGYRAAFLGAALVGAVCTSLILGNSGWIAASTATDTPAASTDLQAEVTQLKAELGQLKTKLAAYAAMNEVDYHSQNLWFAGTAGNWPLAEFYWQRILVHMRLTNAVGTSGSDDGLGQIDLEKYSTLIERTPAMQVGRSIEKRDLRQFASTYRAMLQGCYECHKAIDKPYLRPRTPVPPAQAIINIDPTATWPK